MTEMELYEKFFFGTDEDSLAAGKEIERRMITENGLKRQNEAQYLNDILKPGTGQSTDECFKDILDVELNKKGVNC